MSRAGRKLLARRIKRVGKYLRLAATRPEEDVEYVHQLRVATRRAMAALDGFEPLLPPPHHLHPIRSVLKRLRKAAGTARDLDVLIARIRHRGGRLSKKRQAKVLRRLRRHRRKAQEPIDRGYAQWRTNRVKRRTAGLVKRLRWRCSGSEPTLAEAAHRVLRPQVSAFFRTAQGDLSKVRSLHQLRIEGKQLRYTIELFADAFDPAFSEQVVPEFEQLQDHLGTIIDLVVARDTFKRHGVAASRFVSRNDFDRARQDFRDWWTRKRARCLKKRFDQALSAAESVSETRRASAS
ncbi:MAG: CHAD domain-containing protein [Pirellulales bacterium]